MTTEQQPTGRGQGKRKTRHESILESARGPDGALG